MHEKKILELFLRYKAICTDTRKIIPNAIYFALKGANFNGNIFAKQALESGCSFAIVDEEEYILDHRFIFVKDVLTSLQRLSQNYRSQLDNIIVIGLTGSNGKTTTKELIRDVLRKKFNVFATHGNLNNHIGVPLSLLAIKPIDDFAIIEMGANHVKEIELLSAISQPDFGLITNIGKAHLEGFGGIEGVAKGKAELFDFLRSENKQAFVNIGLPWMKDLKIGLDCIEYKSLGGKYNIRITQSTPTLSFSCLVENKKYSIATNFTGEYNIHNLVAAMVIGLYFEVKPEDIFEALSNYLPENSRSQITITEKNTLILDAYNANPTSLENALINLANMDGKKYFIIGDMLEMGEHSAKEHLYILELIKKLNLEGIVVGEHFIEAAKGDVLSFENNVSAKVFLQEKRIKNHTILIKGSRGIQLEKVIDIL